MRATLGRDKLETPNRLVSVIIPTHNSSETIDLCISSVLSQTYSSLEVVVVDNNSTDRTKEIVKKYKTVRVFDKGPERSTQRNYGVEKAVGEYLIFLDSDIELSPRVVEECMEKVAEGFEVVTFPEAIVGTGFWAKCRALEARCYLSDDSIEAPRFISTRLFHELGGFDEGITGVEDWDLRERILRMGYMIGRIRSWTMHHEGSVDPLERIKKKYYYAMTLDRYIAKYRFGVVRQIPIFRLCYYKNLKILLDDPIHAFGFIILKTLETVAAGIGMFVGKVFRQR